MNTHKFPSNIKYHSNASGETFIIVNISVVFNALMKIICSQWLHELWTPWTSPNSEFPPWRCFARPSLEPSPDAVCASFCPQFSLSTWKAALFGPLRILHLFASKDAWVVFSVSLGSYSSGFILIVLSAVILIDKHLSTCSIAIPAVHAHPITPPPPCLTHSFSIFWSYHHSGDILFVSSVQRVSLQNSGGFSSCFL